jgi:hypothetical protein
MIKIPRRLAIAISRFERQCGDCGEYNLFFLPCPCQVKKKLFKLLNSWYIYRREIQGCDATGSWSVYLTRWAIVDKWGYQMCLHKFHRSDPDDQHDHPWGFVSIILWRGYYEHTPKGVKRIRPGMILVRPAEWVHSVKLVDEKPAYTLIFKGPRKRDWGFHTLLGWIPWKKYVDERDKC